MKFREGELLFDFLDAPVVERLDEPGRSMPAGMSFVDFVVEEDDRVLMIEVKDPYPDAVPPNHRRRVANREKSKFNSNDLIHHELVPKARDSYCYFHLMERDDKPFDFVFLTGVDRLNVTKDQLVHFQDRLVRRLKIEADRRWQRQYVRNCLVLTTSDWNRHMAPYTVERI